MPSDEIEGNFRDFTNRLLAAEETVHRSGQVPLYSPEALGKILSQYCNIIAEDLKAQSCTIQLKLHDLRSCDQLQKQADGVTVERPTHEQAALCWNRQSEMFARRWAKAGGASSARRPQATETIRSRRDRILRDSLAFPYAVFPKGAMWLAAVNEGSPWEPFAKWHVTDLARGVTAQIVQERAAKSRDPLSMRASRNFRKLGDLDPYVWNNELPPSASPRFFFTYYGVPIRIHSGGDVVGTIKIENKGLRDGSPINPLFDDVFNLPLNPNPNRMFQELRTSIGKIEQEVKKCGYEARAWSVLSLAHLAADLSANAESGRRVRDLLGLPYLGPIASGSRQRFPPVQVVFARLEDELEFFENAFSSRNGAIKKAMDIEERVELTTRFYFELNDRLSHRRRSFDADLEQALEELIPHSTATVEWPDNRWDPDFFRRVTVRRRRQRRRAEEFTFFVQACPSFKESRDSSRLQRYYGLPAVRAAAYVRHGTAPPKVGLNGEFVAGTNRIIHLPTDRLAGRIIAFTSSFPIAAFPKDDAWKLSWAAVEIGKLIERQISYRGTHSTPVVPLTADDFVRMPISDGSFVDAVRAQHNGVIAVQTALNYHISNHCRDLGFSQRVEYTQRIKEFRSYFDRIGQSHKAHYDALIVLWSYILYVSLQTSAAAPEDKRLREFKEHLRRLAEALDNLWGKEPPSEFTNWKKALSTWIKRKRIYPDLKFSAPPLTLDKDRRRKARRQLLQNLTRCPQGVQAAVRAPDAELPAARIADLLFRRYDPFIGMSLSLYLQLLNEETKSGYIEFYAECRKVLQLIRERLERSEEQVGRTSPDAPIAQFMEALGNVRVDILSVSTRNLRAFIGSFGVYESETVNRELLQFTPAGIYKRIRTLTNVSTNQLAPALLNWENTRFDYVGGRVTCLFKNQVFATYEEIWSRGDPFHGVSRYRQPRKHRMSRQRWLCLRTKVHSGEDGYSAWQIAALMDSDAVRDDYWNTSTYNLNRLASILAKAYRRWHRDTEAYEIQAINRGALKDMYVKGLRKAMTILDGLGQTSAEPPFGSYLGQTALDLLVYMIGAHASEVVSNTSEILETLTAFTSAALDYARASVTPALSGERRAQYKAPRKLIAAARPLYNLATDLAGDVKSDPRVTQLIFKLTSELATIDGGIPAVFMDDKSAHLIAELRSYYRSLTGNRRQPTAAEHKILLRLMEQAIREIQVVQMDYLFDHDKMQESLHLRSESMVMDRILCYVLLQPIDPNPRDMANDAYSLFYYLMSLTPIEIQIRTELANTMAEQYHRIYKGTDRSYRSSVKQARLKEIAQKLETIDREMEVQFEDYISDTGSPAKEG